MRSHVLAISLLTAASCRRAPTEAAPAKQQHSPPSSQTAFYASSFKKTPTVAAMTAVGRALFFAPELSASGKLACASCHDPGHAFGPPTDLPVQLGGTDGRRSGLRAVPSLRYLQAVPRFNEHYQDSDGDGTDQGPAGGYTWDGRAQSVHDQARLPLFSPLEMSNPSPDALIARLRSSRYAAQLRETFGDDVLETTDRGLKAVLMALEVYQQSPTEFYPYDSKFDFYLRGKVSLSDREARGLRLFNDPAKGNCASCHPSQVKEGAFPAFTDYGFVALGVPRNAAIPANSDSRYFDLGLCGPLRTELSQRKQYCGLFRTPSLRNVTLRRQFFHNGAVRTLQDVLRFYSERDIHPEKWYPRASDGTVRKFDDLPPQYHDNVNMDPPFGRSRAHGSALSSGEMADIIAFLETLKDGYRP
jgi:cytochrome c peroxidase